MPRRAGGRGPILVADADRRSREETARALLNAGYEVVEAATGEEAVDAARRAEPALAVLEVRLPGLSGYEVCRRLREERGDAVPIVFVSGDRVEPSDRVAGLLVGADDYLAKPLASDELVARVRRQLERTDASGRDGPPDRLTAREYEVLRLLASGLVPAQIASALSISPRTVATHVEHIYVKLGVHSRAHAVAAAFRLALVD